MKYKSGDDYKDYDADYPTYGISCGNHTNKIEVYGDAKLRDEILDFYLLPKVMIVAALHAVG